MMNGINRKLILLLTLPALLVTASCSSGGDAEGFCRRWSKVMERVNASEIKSTEELLSAISKSSLGDPGGSFSELRDSLENEIQNGTNEDAVMYTNMISDLCA
jgi:hypothetical protein